MRDFKIKLNRRDARCDWRVAGTKNGRWCPDAIINLFQKSPTTATAMTFSVTEDKPKGIPHDRLKKLWVYKMVDGWNGSRPIVEISPRKYEKRDGYYLANDFTNVLPCGTDIKIGKKFKKNVPVPVWVSFDVSKYDHVARYAHTFDYYWSHNR